MRDSVKACLGALHVDYYGQAERVAFAWSVRDNEYHFLPGYGIAEFVDGQGHEDLEIVATNLQNTAQPLIRYATGDIARGVTPQNARAVALGLTPFGGIEGRSAEFFELEDGSRILGLNHIPRGIPNCHFVQLVQAGPADLRIHVVPSSPEDHDQAIAAINARLDLRFPSSVHRKFVFSETPIRNSRGKSPLFFRMDK